MNTKYVAAAVAAVLVLGGIGAAVFFGVGPMGGAGESKVTDTPESTGTVYEMGGGGGSNGGSGAADGEQLPPYYFTINSIEKCGQTCRDVTVTLTNNRNQTANDVTVYTRIYAGNNTDQSNKVWEGKEQIGTMQPNESVTSTKRVKLSYSEGLKVKNHDGWITIVTTVESMDVTITFKEQRDVA